MLDCGKFPIFHLSSLQTSITFELQNIFHLSSLQTSIIFDLLFTLNYYQTTILHHNANPNPYCTFPPQMSQPNQQERVEAALQTLANRTTFS